MSGAVAVGVFDGLHLGHHQILRRARSLASRKGGRCVVVSFDPHPDVVLSKAFQAPAPLTSVTEKRERLAAFGVDAFELLPFTREMAALSPEAFVERHLVRPFALHSLVVGENFALGRGRTGNVARLREIGKDHGFEVEAVPLLEVDGAPVTSTRIRGLLDEGRALEASRLLGRHYGLGGTVVGGEAIGRLLGVPTANLRLHDEKLVPRDGIYAAWVGIGGEVPRRPGAMSIGVRPTFGGTVRVLEVHLLDWDADLLGRHLSVEFVDWIRQQVRFETPEALAAAMRDDLVEVRRRLALAPEFAAPGPGPGL